MKTEKRPWMSVLLALCVLSSVVFAAEPPKLPLKGGENVLFIGNSLTGSLSE